MSAMSWCTLAVMAIVLLTGVVDSPRHYERIGGTAASDGDLDRVVRESW